MSKVVLYGTRTCPYCVAARRLLQGKGVEYKDISVDGQPQARAELRERSGRHTVPQIWVGETHVGGFDDLQRLHMTGELDKLLNAA